MSREVLRPSRRPKAGKIGWRGTKKRRRRPDPLNPVTVRVRVRHPDSQVDAVAQKVDLGRGDAQVDPQVRMPAQEARQSRGENAAREGGRSDYAKVPAQLLRRKVGFGNLVEPVEHQAALLVELGP